MVLHLQVPGDPLDLLLDLAVLLLPVGSHQAQAEEEGKAEDVKEIHGDDDQVRRVPELD